MSDINVSRAWAEISKSGGPCVPGITVGQRSGDQRPCVVLWADDYNALSTDAERWREQRNALTEAMAKSSAFSDDDDIEDMPLVDVLARMDALLEKACHAYAEAMTDAAKWREQRARELDICPTPSVGENASETTPVPPPSLAERFPVGREVCCNGQVGVVLGTDSSHVTAQYEGYRATTRADAVELLPEAPAPWVPKVGDKVRIKPSIPTDFGVVQSIDAHDGTAMVFVDGCTRWYKITELEPAPTDPAPEEPSKAAFAAWKHRVPVVGERVRALTPNRYGQLGTVNAPAKFDNDADRHGQVVIVSAKMDTGEVVVNGIQWWEPAEPSDGVSLVTDAAMDEMRRKLAAVEKERDEARAKLSLAQVAESFLDSRMTRIRTTLDRVFPAIEEAAQGPRVLEPWEQIERIARERDEARAECEGLRTDIRNLEERCEDLDRDNAAWKAESRDRRSGPTGREAREFEREAFLRFYLAFWRDGEMEGHDALQHAKARAAAARAAMFPKEQKS